MAACAPSRPGRGTTSMGCGPPLWSSRAASSPACFRLTAGWCAWSPSAAGWMGSTRRPCSIPRRSADSRTRTSSGTSTSPLFSLARAQARTALPQAHWQHHWCSRSPASSLMASASTPAATMAATVSTTYLTCAPARVRRDSSPARQTGRAPSGGPGVTAGTVHCTTSSSVWWWTTTPSRSMAPRRRRRSKPCSQRQVLSTSTSSTPSCQSATRRSTRAAAGRPLTPLAAALC
mmetsp:Transcript_89352/g.277923  ORF Transcript_89352/g.277923 Transcript_89352/m.277923 type:complete len:233 (+) Transcript_89352:550-1248(+)